MAATKAVTKKKTTKKSKTKDSKKSTGDQTDVFDIDEESRG